MEIKGLDDAIEAEHQANLEEQQERHDHEVDLALIEADTRKHESDNAVAVAQAQTPVMEHDDWEHRYSVLAASHAELQASHAALTGRVATLEDLIMGDDTDDTPPDTRADEDALPGGEPEAVELQATPASETPHADGHSAEPSKTKTKPTKPKTKVGLNL